MASNLLSGGSRSCGCLRKELIEGRTVLVDGCPRAQLPEYGVWSAMIQRCRNPARGAYARYGGRGIRVCERWRNSFDAFYADVGPRPVPGLQLDRIDNSRGYEPGNVRWATPKENCRHTRRSRMVAAFGRTAPLVEIAEAHGVSYDRLKRRLNSGWSPEDAIGSLREQTEEPNHEQH